MSLPYLCQYALKVNLFGEISNAPSGPVNSDTEGCGKNQYMTADLYGQK